MKKFYLLFTILIIGFSCGNTEELKIHEQKLNIGKVKKQNYLSDKLKEMEALLEEAKSDYEIINEFQIGRSQSTKDHQLFVVNQRIEYLQNYISNIKNELAEAELIQTFDFQNDPQSTLEHLFDSAKKRDFSNLRYLCDPYFENVSKGQIFCFIQILPYEEKESFATEFENARIIGVPVINDQIAVFEVATGPSSNKLIKISLIERLDHWYLSGIMGDI